MFFFIAGFHWLPLDPLLSPPSSFIIIIIFTIASLLGRFPWGVLKSCAVFFSFSFSIQKCFEPNIPCGMFSCLCCWCCSSYFNHHHVVVAVVVVVMSCCYKLLLIVISLGLHNDYSNNYSKYIIIAFIITIN